MWPVIIAALRSRVMVAIESWLAEEVATGIAAMMERGAAALLAHADKAPWLLALADVVMHHLSGGQLTYPRSDSEARTASAAWVVGDLRAKTRDDLRRMSLVALRSARAYAIIRASRHDITADLAASGSSGGVFAEILSSPVPNGVHDLAAWLHAVSHETGIPFNVLLNSR